MCAATPFVTPTALCAVARALSAMAPQPSMSGVAMPAAAQPNPQAANTRRGMANTLHHMRRRQRQREAIWRCVLT